MYNVLPKSELGSASSNIYRKYTYDYTCIYIYIYKHTVSAHFNIMFCFIHDGIEKYIWVNLCLYLTPCSFPWYLLSNSLGVEQLCLKVYK